MSLGGNRKMPPPPHHPTPRESRLHPHGRKSTAVMGISISHMRNQSSGNHPPAAKVPGARASRYRVYPILIGREGKKEGQREVREKGTSILIETKDQKKEAREKRGRNKRIGGRGINLTRDQKIPFVAAPRIFRWKKHR